MTICHTTAKAVMEAIGTAILIFTIQVTVSLEASLAPLAIGFILVSIVYAGGPISGAHYNPAVSLAITLRSKGQDFKPKMMCIYWVAQIGGGILGAVLGGIVDNKFSPFQLEEEGELKFTFVQACTTEVVFAFILCFVVLGVATNPTVADNHYYGLAIGFVVMAGAVSVGPISGGAFNPAVALGLSISNGFANFQYALAVSVANLIGGVCAAGIFSLIASVEEDDGYVAAANSNEPESAVNTMAVSVD